VRRYRPRRVEVLVWLRLMRVQQKLERVAAGHLRRWELSVPCFDVLTHVGGAEGITQQELAAARLTTKGNLSQLLDHMERDGLVRRGRDGRVKRVYLTDAGRQLFAEIVPDHEALLAAQLRATLTTEEIDRLLGLLRTLDHALSPAQPPVSPVPG
jgi:MarR family 2-MHQ and catechol resistance regulon transcriptional repressor